MKNLISLLFALCFLITNCCFAKPVQCPSIDKIRNAQFTLAGWGPPEWVVIGELTNDDGKKWTVGYDFSNDQCKSENEALDCAQKQIKTEALHEPRVAKQGPLTECAYSDAFSVFAINPPTEPHQALTRFHR